MKKNITDEDRLKYNEYKRNYMREKVKLPEVQAQRHEHYIKHRLKNRAKCLIKRQRCTAKRQGVAHNLDQYADLLQARIDNGFCELSGLPFDLSPGRKHNSPSFDRIDPKGGYTYGNIRVVLLCLNIALNSWGEENFIKVMRAWVNNRTQKGMTNG